MAELPPIFRPEHRPSRYVVFWRPIDGDERMRHVVMVQSREEAMAASRAVMTLALGPNVDRWQISEVWRDGQRVMIAAPV